METEHLREFVLLSQGSSITATAQKLGISQSCLSKHIKQLETETGGELFSTVNGKLSVTSHGAEVLRQGQLLLNKLEILTNECRSLDDKKMPELIVQTPSLEDHASRLYRKVFDQFKSYHPDYQVRYSRISNKQMIANLARGRYDVALAYNYGRIKEVQARYTERNCRAVYLTTDRLILWCNKSHSLNRENVRVADLENIPIVVPFDVLAPMQKAVGQLCAAHGFKPKFVMVGTKSQNEFMHADFNRAVYVYPFSFGNSSLITQKETAVTREITDEDAVVHAFIVYSLDNPNLSQDFISYMKEDWSGPLDD